MGAHTKCRIGIGGRQRKEIYETRKSGSRERGPQHTWSQLTSRFVIPGVSAQSS